MTNQPPTSRPNPIATPTSQSQFLPPLIMSSLPISNSPMATLAIATPPLSTPPPASPSAPPANLRVRLFAGLREAAGWAEQSLGWEDARAAASQGAGRGAGEVTPHSLWRQLQLGSVKLPAGLRVAVNHAFADPEQSLQPGDEVAFLPPISGG
jgi:molybdopterin synthase sulfur carrier subunit